MERRQRLSTAFDADPAVGLWLVKVTLGGDDLDLEWVHRVLSELSVERAFLLTARYADDRAEISYWDEGSDVNVAVEQAFALWGSREVLGALPGWQVIGLEVLDRVAARKKWEMEPGRRVFALGEIAPFE